MVAIGLGVGVALCVQFGVLGVGLDVELACAAAQQPPAMAPIASDFLPVPTDIEACCPPEAGTRMALSGPAPAPAPAPRGRTGVVDRATDSRNSPATAPVDLPIRLAEPDPTVEPPPLEPSLPFGSGRHQHLPLPSSPRVAPSPTPPPTPTPAPKPSSPTTSPRPSPKPTPCDCPSPQPAPKPAPKPAHVPPPKPVPPAPREAPPPAPPAAIAPAEAAPPPDRPEDGADWGLISLVALMVPAVIAAAAAAGGAAGGGGPTGPTGPTAGGRP